MIRAPAAPRRIHLARVTAKLTSRKATRRTPKVSDPLQFLTAHGYTLVFVFVLADQAGLPMPSLPVVLAAGALAGDGHLNLLVVLGLSAAGAFLSDTLWYELGRYRGGRVLGVICRLSFEPEVCVRQTQESFRQHGWRSLLVAKFVP